MILQSHRSHASGGTEANWGFAVTDRTLQSVPVPMPSEVAKVRV